MISTCSQFSGGRIVEWRKFGNTAFRRRYNLLRVVVDNLLLQLVFFLYGGVMWLALPAVFDVFDGYILVERGRDL